jgi:hypothetical protein
VRLAYPAAWLWRFSLLRVSFVLLLLALAAGIGWSLSSAAKLLLENGVDPLTC